MAAPVSQGQRMGDGIPGTLANRVLDGETARAAIAEAGTLRDLDAMLERSAQVLLQRLGADVAIVRVYRHARGLFWAPLSGPLSGDLIFPNWESFRDPEINAQVQELSSKITNDLAVVDSRTPGQQAMYRQGVRSAMWTALKDEHGEALGFVLCGALPAHAFAGTDLRELEQLSEILARYVRPALLIEEQRAERELLRVETGLLAALAESETEAELLDRVVDGVQRALKSDLALLLLGPVNGGRPSLRSSPAAALSPAQLKSGQDAVATGDNDSMVERARIAGSYDVADLRQDGETPLEGWFRDSLGMTSYAAARSKQWGSLSIGIAALREHAGPWSEAERTFLARQARVLELNLERFRRGEIAVDRNLKLERQAELLSTGAELLEALSSTEDLASACTFISGRIRSFFEADHVAFGLLNLAEKTRTVLGFSSGVMTEVEFSENITEHDVSVYGPLAAHGAADVLSDLSAHDTLNDAAASLARRGVMSLMRAPFKLSDGSVGIVTVGSRRAGHYTGSDAELLLDLCRPVGVSIDRVRLLRSMSDSYDETARRTAKTQALTRLLSTLNLNDPPETVAREFAAQVREYLVADGVMVYAFDQQTGQRIRVAYESPVDRTRTPERVSLSDSLAYEGTAITPLAMYSSSMPGSAPAWLASASEAMGYASTVCVRLDADGDAVGMIAAGSFLPDVMGAAELEILSAVAAPLGMVLERARAVTNLRLQTLRTTAVLDILAALGPAETLEAVADPVASALRAMYNADHCAIGVIDQDQVTLVAVDSAITDWAPGDTISFNALTGEAAIVSRVLHVTTDLAETHPLPVASALARDRGMRSSMRVLIGTPTEPLGVVTVGSRQPGRFTEFDAQQLVQIVQPLAVTVRYFQDHREAILRAARLETTNRILSRLGAGGTVEHLATAFLEECRTLFACRHAIAVEFDAPAGTGRVLAIDTDFPIASGQTGQFSLTEMHTARMMLHPATQLVADARTEPLPNARHLHMFSVGMYSVIRAPLVVHDTVRGAVSLWGEGISRFVPEDAELLGTLTRPLALALEKASALQSLAESELKYRSLMAQADEMIFLFEPESLRLLDANAFTADVLGYEQHALLDLTLDTILEATRDDIAWAVAGAILDGELHLSDLNFRRADGSLIDVEAVASMVTYGGKQAVLVLARNVSERKALMRQLIQSQKMDSLGAMAGTVAHDFNNLLTTILGFAGLLKRSPNLDEEERENLALIEEAARRAADLTGRLLSFSRGGLARFGRVDLRDVVDDTLKLAEPTMHSGLTVTRDVSDAPVYVEGDAGQLQQALTNIVLNARDAMPEGGTITVSLATEGAIAVVTLTDNGPGMDEETRMRIFEPFYTTKPAGSGTGLGMAITYGIIQGHHGDIAIQSERGAGTTFTISLPLLVNSAEPVDAFNAGDGNLVLVVDDDAMVRRTTTATLAELGYNVVEAPGGATAVEILRARPDRFSVVLLDLVMPGMTGSETFRALTAIRPDIPVVVCTGYAADSHIDTDVKRRIAGLVQKPFSAERLSRALLAVGAIPTRSTRI